MAGFVLRKKILETEGLRPAFFNGSPHTRFHLGVVLGPPELTFNQLDGLVLDGLLISQAGQIDAFCRLGYVRKTLSASDLGEWIVTPQHTGQREVARCPLTRSVCWPCRMPDPKPSDTVCRLAMRRQHGRPGTETTWAPSPVVVMQPSGIVPYSPINLFHVDPKVCDQSRT